MVENVLFCALNQSTSGSDAELTCDDLPCRCIQVPEMATEGRLPLHDPRRIKARDARVLEREEHVYDRDRLTSVRCPCNICMGEVRSKRKRDMVMAHLEDVGRYPYLRGRTKVNNARIHHF